MATKRVSPSTALSPARKRALTELAHSVVRQMGRTDVAVADALKRRPKSDWKQSLPSIAAAAFSDAFVGMSAVAVLRNPRARKFGKRFLATMRRELEDRERSWNAQQKPRRAA